MNGAPRAADDREQHLEIGEGDDDAFVVAKIGKVTVGENGEGSGAEFVFNPRDKQCQGQRAPGLGLSISVSWTAVCARRLA